MSLGGDCSIGIHPFGRLVEDGQVVRVYDGSPNRVRTLPAKLPEDIAPAWAWICSLSERRVGA